MALAAVCLTAQCKEHHQRRPAMTPVVVSSDPEEEVLEAQYWESLEATARNDATGLFSSSVS